MEKNRRKFELSSAIYQLPLGATEKLALKILVDIYNPQMNDNIFPSMKNIALSLSKSEGHTRRIVNGLSKKGWLVIKDTKNLGPNNTSYYTSNRYYLPDSILLHQKFLDAQIHYERTLILGKSSLEVSKAQQLMEDIGSKLDIAKQEVIDLKLRESQVNGFQGAAARLAKNYEKEEARKCQIVEIKKKEALVAPSDQMGPTLMQDPPLGLLHVPPNIEARLNINSNTKFNHKSMSPPSITEHTKKDVQIIESCIDLFVKKFQLARPSCASIVRFEHEFKSRNFTFDKFEKNIHLLFENLDLRHTTYSILRVLDAELASKVIHKKYGKSREFIDQSHKIDAVDHFPDCQKFPKKTDEISTTIEGCVRDLLIEINDESMSMELKHIDDLSIRSLLQEPLIEPVDDGICHTKGHVHEFFAILREKIFSKNFSTLLSYQEVCNFLSKHLISASSLRDLKALVLHPLFQAEAARNAA